MLYLSCKQKRLDQSTAEKCLKSPLNIRYDYDGIVLIKFQDWIVFNCTRENTTQEIKIMKRLLCYILIKKLLEDTCLK